MKTLIRKILFLAILSFAFASISAQNNFSVVPNFLDAVGRGSIAFADIDNDGDKDLLMTGGTSSGFISKLYTNNGSGNFTVISGTPFDRVSLSSVAFADVDGDGDQDVLITGDNGLQPISKLYTNNGLGSFSLVSGTIFEGVALSSVAFADIDGDNDQDVLITGLSYSSGFISKLYSNNGSGGFTLVPGTPFDGVFRGSVAFADVDGDLDQDVLITGNGSSKLYTNNGSGSFSLLAGTPFDGVADGSVDFADVDGDGDQDLLITGHNSSAQRISKLYSNNGSGGFTLVLWTPFDGVHYSSIAFSDVDGDGDQDVLITGLNNSADQPISKLYSNDGSGSFSLVSGTPFDGIYWGSVAFADVDDDSDEDVLISGLNSAGQPTAFLYRNLNCQINNPSTSTETITACNSFDWMGSIFTSSGTYLDTILSTMGCDSVTILNLTINKLDTSVSLNGSTLTANLSDASYQWLDCNNGYQNIVGDTNQSYTPSVIGDYAVIVNNNICSDTSFCYTVSRVGLSENTFKIQPKIYPNPTIGVLTLTFDEYLNNATIRLTSIDGKIIFIKKQLKGRQFSINLNDEDIGMYFLEIREDNRFFKTKVVKN